MGGGVSGGDEAGPGAATDAGLAAGSIGTPRPRMGS
jgi:hypothetical protein